MLAQFKEIERLMILVLRAIAALPPELRAPYKVTAAAIQLQLKDVEVSQACAGKSNWC